MGYEMRDGKWFVRFRDTVTWNAHELRHIADKLDERTAEANKPPKPRPLTRKEWEDRREWWMRLKGSDLVRRIGVIGAQSIWPDGSVKCLFQDALEHWEMSPDLKTWHPCGLPESEVAE